MIGIEIINYSLKNLWQSKSRSFLTILSIFVGIATIFIFISLDIMPWTAVGLILMLLFQPIALIGFIISAFVLIITWPVSILTVPSVKNLIIKLKEARE